MRARFSGLALRRFAWTPSGQRRMPRWLHRQQRRSFGKRGVNMERSDVKHVQPFTGATMNPHSIAGLHEKQLLMPEIYEANRYSMEPEAKEDLARVLSLWTGNAKELRKARFANIVAQYGRSPQDTGSTAVQIGVLTDRLLTMRYQIATTHGKDQVMRRRLLKLTARRRKLLRYLRRKDPKGYLRVMEEMRISEFVMDNHGRLYADTLRQSPAANDPQSYDAEQHPLVAKGSARWHQQPLRPAHVVQAERAIEVQHERRVAEARASLQERQQRELARSVAAARRKAEAEEAERAKMAERDAVGDVLSEKQEQAGDDEAGEEQEESKGLFSRLFGGK